HGAENPVAVPGVPQDAANISEQERLRRSSRQQLDSSGQLQGIRFGRPQNGYQQGRNRNPGQKVPVGKREDDDLKSGGKQSQKPGTEMNLPHVFKNNKQADLPTGRDFFGNGYTVGQLSVNRIGL